MARRCRLVWPGGTAWSVYESNSIALPQRVYNLPGSAAAGSFTVACASTFRGTPDGCYFTVKCDGVTKISSPCIVDGSQGCAVPANTLQITVDITLGCLSGAGVVWTLSGGGG